MRVDFGGGCGTAAADTERSERPRGSSPYQAETEEHKGERKRIAGLQ
jgi:hypothetical protein